MNAKNKFVAGVKAGFKATFHKGKLLGKMGYLHDELEVVGNSVNYMSYTNNDIKICQSYNDDCNRGIKEFVNKHYQEAFNLFKKVSLTEQPEGRYLLAVCMIYGRGTKKDLDEGIKQLKMGLSDSDCCKQFLARCYIEGSGIPVNKKKAYELLSKVLFGSEEKKKSDIDYDYLLPDILYFCGEYELENGDIDNGIKHLKIAAIERNYGLAYYLLGKHFFETQPQIAKMYLDKAKKMNVNVSSCYYADERTEVSDESLDFGVSDRIENLSNTLDNLSNIKENLENFDPERIIKTHEVAKRERINAKTEVNKAKAMITVTDTDIETTKIESETKRLEADSKRIKAERKNKRWKERNTGR